MTDEVASVEADDDRMFARLNVFGDEDISGDGMAIDHLICNVVGIESGELLLDSCDYGGIHAEF